MSSVSQTSSGATQRCAGEPLMWKSSSDVVIAGILMVLTAPLIFAAWALVRLTSRGPGFYSQIRLGLGGRHFRIYKLRSMAHDCERETGPRWSTRGDSRVTPFGRFLRSTHIDELPQLLNILRGDMSLVGPRPERPEIAAQLERALPCYRERLQIRPGVTGLAQVQLPPDTDLDSVRRNWRATSTIFGRTVRGWTLVSYWRQRWESWALRSASRARSSAFLTAMWFRKPTATIPTRWTRFPTESSRLLRSIWPETCTMIF